MFGSLMGDFEDDPIFGHHMRSMRQMNNMMSSMFGDPFGAFDALTGGGFGQQQNQQQVMGFGGGLMPFGFPAMPNMNRLLSGEGMEAAGPSFCSSSVISMTQGPDGRPQVYQATSSTKTGPGGIRETQKTVQDSRTGVKKMAIGHHIGERAHIIEREQNMRSGQQEERQDFINLEEDDAEDFDREFTQKARHGMRLPNAITEVGAGGSRRPMPAIMPAEQNPSSTSKRTEEAEPKVTLPPSPPPTSYSSGAHVRRGVRADHRPHTQYHTKNQSRTNLATPRRPLRTPTSSPLTMSSGLNNFMSPRTSIHPHPYNNASPQVRRTHHRQMKDRSQHVNNHQHHVQIEELPDDYDDGAHNSRQ